MALILVLDDNPDLATLLASALTERGHQPVVCLSGADAIAALGARPVAAAVVDLLLPDMRGTEILRALAQRGIPALAMSGVFRGERFAREATSVCGARAFFEKPFSTEALLAALDEALGAPARPPAPPTPEVALEEAVDVDPDDPAARDEALDATMRALALERAEEQRRAQLRDLPFAARQVWSGAEQEGRAKGEAPGPQSGILQGTSVPRLLAASHQGRFTGELRLSKGQVIKIISMQQGRPLYAASNVAAERFGRYAVQQGAMRAEDLATIQELATKEKVRTGEAMVRLGLLTPAQRKALLHDQARQIVWSTFDWPSGTYRFIPRAPSRADFVPLELEVAPLVLGGIGQLPLVRLRERMPPDINLMPSADPPFELHELGLDGAQARLLAAADGTKSRDDLVALADLDERGALALLLALQELKILEPRPRAPGKAKIVMV